MSTTIDFDSAKDFCLNSLQSEQQVEDVALRQEVVNYRQQQFADIGLQGPMAAIGHEVEQLMQQGLSMKAAIQAVVAARGYGRVAKGGHVANIAPHSAAGLKSKGGRGL